MMEFHISRNARQRYQFAESLFSYTGNVVFANMAACREFAYRMNQVRTSKIVPAASSMRASFTPWALLMRPATCSLPVIASSSIRRS